MAGNPDQKRAPRRRDPGLMRMLHAMRGKCCALTGQNDNVELHHVLPRSQGGDDVRANLIFLNRDVHRVITLNDRAAREMLGQFLLEHRPDTLAYLAEKGATGWAERQLFIDISWLARRPS